MARDSLTGYVNEDVSVYIKINLPKLRNSEPLEKFISNLLLDVSGNDYSDLPIKYINRELAVIVDDGGNYTILIKSDDYVGLNQYLDKNNIKYLNCKFDLTVISNSLVTCPEKNDSDFTRKIRKGISTFDSLNIYTKDLFWRGIVRGDRLLIGDVGSKPRQIEYAGDYDFVFSSVGIKRGDVFSYSGAILPDDYLKLFNVELEKLESFFIGVKNTNREGGFLTSNDFLVVISGSDDQIEGIEGLILFELSKEYPITRNKQLTDGTIVSEVVADPDSFELDDNKVVISDDLSIFMQNKGDYWVITNNNDWLSREIDFKNMVYLNKVALPELNLWHVLNSFDYISFDGSWLNLY